MDDMSRFALDLLQDDTKARWIRDQLVASFSEGITQSAKERMALSQFDYQLETAGLTQRERIKREKYETSRPYEESEKVELVRFALREVFVTIPSVQLAALRSLKDLGSEAVVVEFTPPDEEEQVGPSSAHAIRMEPQVRDDLRKKFDEFSKNLEL